MQRAKRAAWIGVVATAFLFILLAVPYGYARPGAVATYYGAGPAGMAFVALLALIVSITLQAGARNRSDPPTTAGLAVTMSLIAAALATTWALPARAVVSGMAVPAWFEYHSFGVVLATGVLALAAGLFARSALADETP